MNVNVALIARNISSLSDGAVIYYSESTWRSISRMIASKELRFRTIAHISWHFLALSANLPPNALRPVICTTINKQSTWEKRHCRRCYAQNPSSAPNILPCLLFLAFSDVRHLGEIDGSGGTCVDRERRLRRYDLPDFTNISLS